MVCRTWSLQTGVYASGLCSFGLLPETSNPTKSCILCLEPLLPPGSNVCGCPSGETEGSRSYTLTVEEGPLGFLSSWAEWYGEFRLSNLGVDGSYGCGGGVSFSAATGPIGEWNVIPSFDVTTSGGKRYRAISIRAEKRPSALAPSTASITWSVPESVPACLNRDRFHTRPTYIRIPADESSGTNPYFPDVIADHFSLTLEREY